MTVLRSTGERVARTSCLSVKRDAPPRLPPTEGPFLKGPYLWRYGTHIHKTGHSVVEKSLKCQQTAYCCQEIMWKCVNRSDYSKIGRRSISENSSKNSEKVLVVFEYF